MPIVDYWLLVENQHNPRRIIASGQNGTCEIKDEVLYNQIKAYVRS